MTKRKVLQKLKKYKEFSLEKQKIGNAKKLSDTRWKWSKNRKNDIII